jgi:hypothetical protein
MFVKRTLQGALAVVLAASPACRQGVSPEAQARIDSLTTAAAERDQLINEMAQNTRFLSAIGADLSKVQIRAKDLKLPRAESPSDAVRDTVAAKIRWIATRMRETDARLKDSEQHVRSLTQISDSLRATLESTLTNFQQMVDNQKVQIASLAAQVDTLRGENGALRDTLGNLTAYTNTVYYIVGTKDDLIKKGIISEEGGSRFLFVLWKSGKTLVPARNLDPHAFTAIDKRQVTSIPLSDPGRTYRIVSRNDLSALGVHPAEDGTISGPTTLPIAEPGRFWASTKFLIIVEG